MKRGAKGKKCSAWEKGAKGKDRASTPKIKDGAPDRELLSTTKVLKGELRHMWCLIMEGKRMRSREQRRKTREVGEKEVRGR